MTSSSELATLVETEQRLDDAVVSARTTANEIRAAAQQRAKAASDQLEQSIETERERIARSMADEAAARERAIEQDARDRIARFQTVRADELDRIARVLARRVLEIAMEEP